MDATQLDGLVATAHGGVLHATDDVLVYSQETDGVCLATSNTN